MNYTHISLILDNQINRIIREHELSTVIVSSKLASYIKDFLGFSELSESQRMSYKDTTGCGDVGYLNNCFVIADSKIPEHDMNIYKHGNTEETQYDNLLVESLDDVVIMNNTTLFELFKLL